MTRGITTALLVCLAVFLGLTAPAANAAIGSYAGSIDVGTVPNPNVGPGSLGVNSLTGDIYAANRAGGNYWHYNSLGALVATVDGPNSGVPDNRECDLENEDDLSPRVLMPDALTGNLFIANLPRISVSGCDRRFPDVYRFSSSDLYVETVAGQYVPPAGTSFGTDLLDMVRVPATGNFYSLWSNVPSEKSLLVRNASGALISEIVPPAPDPSGIPAGTSFLGSGWTHIAVDPASGDIYLGGVVNSTDAQNQTYYTPAVTKLASGTWTPMPLEVSTEGLPDNFNPARGCYMHGYALAGLALDGPNDRLYAAVDNFCQNPNFSRNAASIGAVLEWENDQPVGVLNGNTTVAGAWSGATSNGIAVNQANGMFYVSDPVNNMIHSFDAEVVPEADSGSATPTDPFTETVIGSVNPSGEPVTSCYIRWGTTTAYGQIEPCRQAPEDLGDGTDPITVSAVLNVPTPNSPYHYQVVAGNANGSQAGFDVTFVSAAPGAPEIVGTPSADASSSPVVLSASINPHFGTTSYYFRYGLSTSYGQQTTTQQLPFTDDNPHAVSAQMPTNLVPGATYHVSAFASNSAGSDASSDFTFVAPINAPNVSGAGTTSVGQTSAQFYGWVDPGGGSGACEFEIVSDANYQTSGNPYALGFDVPCSPANVSGNGTTGVTASTSGLQPNVLYHGHMKVEGSGGSSDSGDFTFLTDPLPPAISGLSATNIGTTTATLQAQLVRNSEPVTYYFQYGVSLAYGLKSPTVTATSDGLVSFNVTGLAPGTAYHGSLVAVGRTGATTTSEDVSFTTAVAVNPPPAPVAPEVFFYSGPRPQSAEQQAIFVFSGSASVSRYECRIDAGTWLPCSSGFNTSVVPGDHMFELRGLTASGASSNVFTYYWTVNIPQQCVVKTARARLLLNTSNRQAGLTTKYKTYSPAKNVVSIFYAKMKGGKRVLLGQSTTNFKTAGTVKVVKPIDKATWKKVKKAKSFAMQLKVPHVQAICNQYLTKPLTIKKVFSGNPVWFQWDALFSPKPLTR